MTLARAVACILFAGKSRRAAASAGVRMAVFVGVAMLVAVLTYRVAPRIALPSGPFAAQSALFLMANAGAALLFMVSDAHQQGMLRRLRPLCLLPLSMRAVRRARAAACLPLAAVTVVFVLPILAAATNANTVLLLGSFAWCTFILLVHGGVAIVFSGSAKTRQVIRAVHIIASCVLLPASLAGHPVFGVRAQYAAAALLVLCCAQLVYCIRRPLHQSFDDPRMLVHEQTWLAKKFWILLRVVRTPRYRVVSMLLLAVCVGGSLVVHYKVAGLPIDAIAVATLVLAGTYGQEIRSADAKTYPFELALAGKVVPWFMRQAAVALGMAVVFIDTILVIAVLYFPQQLGVGYMKAGCMGIAFLSAGVLSASALVPYTTDFFMQFGSTALYAILVWLVLHYQPTVAVLVVLSVVAFVLAYLLERLRWLHTIRGWHGIC